jgi:hypothetical protein
MNSLSLELPMYLPMHLPMHPPSALSMSSVDTAVDEDANAVKEAIKFVAEFVNGIYHRNNILICNDVRIGLHLYNSFSKPLILELETIGTMDVLLSKTKLKKAPSPQLELRWKIELKRIGDLLTSLIIKVNDIWKHNTWATSAYTIYNCKEFQGLYIVECNPNYDPRHKLSDYIFIYKDTSIEYSHHYNRLYI